MQDAQDTRYRTARVRLAALIREPLEDGKDISQVKLPLRTAVIPASWPAQDLPATSQRLQLRRCCPLACPTAPPKDGLVPSQDLPRYTWRSSMGLHSHRHAAFAKRCMGEHLP